MDFAKLHLHWRSSKYKNKTYRSYSLARPFYKDGKNLKDIIFKLGKLSDDEATKWRDFLKTFKKPDAFYTTLDDIGVIDHFSYLDIAAVSTVWDEWKLDDVFQNNGKRNLDVATITRILAINRCFEPTSKSQVPDWVRTTSLPWLLDFDPELVNASRIFRELTVIEEYKEDICQHLFSLLQAKSPRSMKTVFYDLSSASLTGTKCILMKWGHCKEGYRNHVVLAIVVNSEGIPFYWEVLPGNTADSTTITWLLSRLKKRFKVSNITVVFDRGMVSDDNLILLEGDEIKYISAMDRNQIEKIAGIDFAKYSFLTAEQADEQANELPKFKKLNNTTHYREIKVENKRRYILCFNPQLFKNQRKARIQAVEDFKIFVDMLNTQLLEAKNTRQRKATYKKFDQQLTKAKISGFVDVKLSRVRITKKNRSEKEYIVRTYQGSFNVDEKKMLAAGKLDGFWLLVTNHIEKTNNRFTVSAKNAIAPYHDKVVIESAFRDIKSFIDVSPIYVWTESHVKAHFTVCVLAYLINRTITLRLHKNKGDLSADVVAHEKLYKRLSSCLIDHIKVKNVDLTTYQMTCPTEVQKELVKRLNLSDLLKPNILRKANS